MFCKIAPIFKNVIALNEERAPPAVYMPIANASAAIMNFEDSLLLTFIKPTTIPTKRIIAIAHALKSACKSNTAKIKTIRTPTKKAQAPTPLPPTFLATLDTSFVIIMYLNKEK